MDYEEVIIRLKAKSHIDTLTKMARFGININNSYGVKVPDLRALAKDIGTDRNLAEQLWLSGIRDARLLATLVTNPKDLTEEIAEKWVTEVDSWDVCDGLIINLVGRSGLAHQKAWEWTLREEEFVKRAGFVLISYLALHDKKADDTKFEFYLKIIQEESTEKRNFAKKAVNWALRQIGKRNQGLNRKALEIAQEILDTNPQGNNWIANDAIRELTSLKTLERLKRQTAGMKVTKHST
jgi:3-methyladenine DNA glycosylase AlkD